MSETTLDWPKLMHEALTAPGHLGNTYSRFHDYSLANMLLFRQQGMREPMASASRWKSLGHHILSGVRGKEVIVPVLINEPAPTDETVEEKRERVAKLIRFKVVRRVFALSDTEGPELPPVPTPGWDLQTALGKLGIREVPFDQTNGNLQGWSQGLAFAINPIAVNPTKTRLHELAHIVLGHTIPNHYEEYATHRGIMEFQAEAVAYLAMNELGQLDDDMASRSRGYIQHWLSDEQPPDKAIQQVFRATDAILRAGRLAVTEGE